MQDFVRESLDLPLPSGKKQRILYVHQASPHGAIVMLPGGTGDLSIDEEGDISHKNNFVVRTQALWLDQGYAVIIPDALDGQNMRGLRSEQEYTQVVATLVKFAHEQTPGPVFLLGTSQGAIAAMNGAAHLAAPDLAGVVLSESVSQRGKNSRETVDASPELVTVPTLIVANRTSKCRLAPAEDAPRIKAAMTRAVEVEILYVQGGNESHSPDPCSSLSPHGYLGIEPEVVTKIGAWLKAHQ